ncbi:MAG: saccharopine dehydrogenase family protein [Polyangiales bacterium]
MSKGGKDIDILLYGATGYTGRLVAAELLAGAPPGLRIGWAGRSAARLAALQAELAGARRASTVEVTLYPASLTDAGTLHALARQSCVLLNAAGPFARLAAPLVQAAVAERADYADLSGEPAHVQALLRHHSAAIAAGVRLVPCCGFDSVPFDMGVWMMVQAQPAATRLHIEAVLEGVGGYSGGSLHTATCALAALSRAEWHALWGPEAAGAPWRSCRYDRRLRAWCAPMPSVDRQIVALSAARLPHYPADFRYTQWVATPSLPRLLGMGLGTYALSLGARSPWVRQTLQRIKAPGTGPSMAARAGGWFALHLYASDGDRQLRGLVAGGEPGYTETARIFAAAGLSLWSSRQQGQPAGGVLTPAAALAAPYLARLRACGLHFTVLSAPPQRTA